jgi:hypothetical protein
MTERKLIDNCFFVEKKKWGTWDSYDTDGKCIITSLTEENCIAATRFHLKMIQEQINEQTNT